MTLSHIHRSYELHDNSWKRVTHPAGTCDFSDFTCLMTFTSYKTLSSLYRGLQLFKKLVKIRQIGTINCYERMRYYRSSVFCTTTRPYIWHATRLRFSVKLIGSPLAAIYQGAGELFQTARTHPRGNIRSSRG